MSSNQTLLQKADLTLADLAANGGLLNPEQSNTFIRKLIEAPSILNVARVVEMNAPTRKINKIQFDQRILRIGTSATALQVQDRSAPVTEQIELNSKEYIAEVRLPYDVIEDNIERGNVGAMTDTNGTPAGGGLIDTVLTLMAERVALDLEEAGLLGDVGSSDDYLACADGFLNLINAGGNVVNHGGGTIDKLLFKSGLLNLPDQYKRNLGSMWHMISKNNEIEYRDTLADRATALGDANIQARNPVFGFGVPILGVDLMPETLGMLTNPLNLLYGIQRQILFEFDKIIAERVYQMVVTTRVAFQVEETLAAVEYTNIGPAPL